MRISNFKFTKKNHPQGALISTMLGIVALVFLSAVIYMTFLRGGTASSSFGVVAILALLFSTIGLILAIVSRFKKDMYYLFAHIGIIINIINITLILVIVYFGLDF